ncbi:MAG: hypothetical protein DDT22_01345 [candidate division WS2 bacterium]|nr:hypothetical protein [Candidatus Lithacetigena glycinireducens]
MVLATKEEKGKPETPPGLSEKTNIKVAFKGVVVEINVLGNINIIKVVLVEPFFKILKKRIDAGETINVNIEKATFFKAPEGKLDTKPSLLNEYVQILGVYEETITPKIVNAKIVRILVQPPGHVIGMGKITILGTNSFALEMKPRKGEKDLVTL